MERMEDKYDIRATIMSGIICRKCNGKLPDMTIEDHLQSAFNMECPHALPEKVYETPTMMWVRINNQMRDKAGLSDRMPTNKERTKWVKSCEENREMAREAYLAIREEYDDSEPNSVGYKFCLSMKNVENRIIERGDDFHKRIKAVFDGLY